ncbi:MAG: Zn-ribbon domain-containing OB-fold protein [Anaerolineae bacterium]|jgi:uncharacterized OB-fold protein
MSLLYRIEHLRDAIAWEGDIPITSRYTAGLAGERFFREIQENGQLLGTRCPECDRTYVPPRLNCERCFSKLDEWVEVPSTGTVHTFTVVHLDLDGSRSEEPHILAFVRLDNTDGGLVHFLSEVEPAQLYIGMYVEAVFRDKEERKGSILDIAYFRPV